MAIKLTCPQCKTPLQVPTKLLGQYTQCPACQSRILIPPQSADVSLSGSSVSVAAAAQDETARAAAPEGENGRGAPAGRTADASKSPLPAAAAGRGTVSEGIAQYHSSLAMPAAVWSDHAPAEPAPQRKVARFITADSAPSTVQLAPGGELPKLQLTEGVQVKRGTQGPGMNPLVLVGAACLSFCMCIVLLLMDFDTTTVDSQQENRIRQQLESYYKDQDGLLAPYQAMLREAQQARSRGDRPAEQRQYRKVLDLLHAERRDPHDRFRGLTGTPRSDQNLEKLLASLLTGSSSESSEE
jgi:DNA-directed RNA polymerase subunit RPC12/RpoP